MAAQQERRAPDKPSLKTRVQELRSTQAEVERQLKRLKNSWMKRLGGGKRAETQAAETGRCRDELQPNWQEQAGTCEVAARSGSVTKATAVTTGKRQRRTDQAGTQTQQLLSARYEMEQQLKV